MDNGLTADQEAEITASIREYEREQRWRALKALWLPAVIDEAATARRVNKTVCFRDNRGDDWTFWRAVRATIGLLLARYQTDEHDREFMRLGRRKWPIFGYEMAFWDSEVTYGLYAVDVLQLFPRCRISVFNDDESSM